MSKDSTASLRGWRRKSVVAKCPPEDGYRDVGGAQMPSELRRWVNRKRWQALRDAEFHSKRGATLAKRFADGRASVLVELVKRFPKQPRQASGAANDGSEPPLAAKKNSTEAT